MSPLPDYYTILQVSKDATLEEIKQAFRRKARQYHPDLHPDNPDSEEKFKQICQAYEALCESVTTQPPPQQPPEQKPQFNYQDFYVRGKQKSLAKDYQGALNNYNQAIALNPNFVEAYLQRCEIFFKLQDDRRVLGDCYQLLQLNPEFAPAYYYQGRSRFRLGYLDSAIEAYTQAINYQPDYPQAYYYRSLAYLELQQKQAADLDLATAAQLFYHQKDWSGYNLAKDTREKIKFSFSIFTQLKKALVILLSVIINPSGAILPAFARLQPQEALLMGIFYGVCADLLFVIGLYDNNIINWQWQLILVGLVPFITLVMGIAIARFFSGSSGSLPGDIFIAGVALIPSGLLTLASLTNVTIIIMILTIFVSCYTILILYSGCTQIANINESLAAFLLPIILLITGGCSYWALMVI